MVWAHLTFEPASQSTKMEFLSNHQKVRGSNTTLGIDITENVFQLHGTNKHGKALNSGLVTDKTQAGLPWHVTLDSSGRRAVGENTDRRIRRAHWVKDTRQGWTQWFTRPGEQDALYWVKPRESTRNG